MGRKLKITHAAATVQADPRPMLITIPNVELMETGTWRLSTGLTTFTSEDLQAAVAALDDPAVPTPRVKIGHTDPRFDGEPVLGKIENLRLENEGNTLVGDLVGVPAWLADIMPSAYPQRSIEGVWNIETATGKKHQFMLTGVALLGDTLPGIETLEDLQDLFVNGPELVEAQRGEAQAVRLTLEEDEGVGNRVAAAMRKMRGGTQAAVEVEDVRRGYYESLGADQMWWWIRAIQLDPQQLIVDDDEGSIYRVPYTVSGEDVEFGDPVEVVIEYKDKGTSKTAASGTVATWASREDSRPTKEEEGMDKETRDLLIARFGLSADATDEQIKEALKAEQTPDPGTTPEEQSGQDAPSTQDPDNGGETPSTEVTTPDGTEVKTTPEGAVVLDKAQFEELKTAASQGAEARARQVREDRERYVDDAVKAGKFPPSRKDHYLSLLEKDEEGTKQFIDSLAAGVIPVKENGIGADVLGEQEAYPASWLPEVQASKQQATITGEA